MTETDMQIAREEEDRVLSRAVQVALHTFMEVCGNSEDEYTTEERIDAASRILGYAATFQPEITLGIQGGGDDDSDSEEAGDAADE